MLSTFTAKYVWLNPRHLAQVQPRHQGSKSLKEDEKQHS